MEEIIDGKHGRVVLPEYVLVEFATVLAARAGMDITRRAVHDLTNAREVEFVRCSRILPQAYSLFQSQQRARLSLVDCTLIEMARDEKDPAIATFDRAIAERDDVRALPAA